MGEPTGLDRARQHGTAVDGLVWRGKQGRTCADSGIRAGSSLRTWRPGAPRMFLPCRDPARNRTRPTRLAGAVEALPLIERMNQVLADRGALYEVEGDMYFSRAADPEFGAVSHLDPATMVVLAAERGGDPARPGKKDPLDPLVWLIT